MTDLPTQLATHLRHVFKGGNWTSVNFRDVLADVTLEEVLAVPTPLTENSIARLVYHVHYYALAQIDVLEGRPLTARDKYSFDHPPIATIRAWLGYWVETVLPDVERLAVLIGNLDANRLQEPFAGDGKYGTVYRNLQGAIEHAHYHLGQVVLVKRWVRRRAEAS